MMTDFLTAAKTGDAAEVNRLLETGGIDINESCQKEETALHKAIDHETGHLDVVKILLKHGATPLLDERRETPAYSAAQRNHVSILVILLANENHSRGLAGHKNIFDVPVMWFPVCYGYENIVHILLSIGCSASYIDGRVPYLHDSGTSLLCVAASNGYLRIAEMLIEKGAQVTFVGNDGETPLHKAASRNHVEMVRLLLKHGARNCQDHEGESPSSRTTNETIRGLLT